MFTQRLLQYLNRMLKTPPPTVRYQKVKLPLTTLNVMTAGKGEPLIMVPATISNLANWISLVQFVAQKYKVYFFELPGHGGSTPFKKPFTLSQVTQTIEDLADKLKITKFALLGFSFGGILALATLHKLDKRITKIILIAPCVTSHAIKYSPSRMKVVRLVHRLSERPSIENGLLRLMHSTKTVGLVIKLLNHLGKVEKTMKLKEKLLSLPKSTLDVLIGQTNAILTADFSQIGKFDQPAFFAMSVHDPLLDFTQTLAFMEVHFTKLSVKRSYFPYHQPPRPFSFSRLNTSYKDLLNVI